MALSLQEQFSAPTLVHGQSVRCHHRDRRLACHLLGEFMALLQLKRLLSTDQRGLRQALIQLHQRQMRVYVRRLYPEY